MPPIDGEIGKTRHSEAAWQTAIKGCSNNVGRNEGQRQGDGETRLSDDHTLDQRHESFCLPALLLVQRSDCLDDHSLIIETRKPTAYVRRHHSRYHDGDESCQPLPPAKPLL